MEALTKIITMEGYKGYVGALVAVGAGVYLAREGNVEMGVGLIGLGLSQFGVRAKIERESK